MSRQVFIGIDIATENVRAVAIDNEGNLYGSNSEKLAPVTGGSDKRLTQDPASWIAAVRKVLKEETTQVDNSLLNIIKEFGLYSITTDVGLSLIHI